MPSVHALFTPFSTEGTKTRSTFCPVRDSVNSSPVSRGLGSRRIQTSANWPAPPVCFLWRAFVLAPAFFVFRPGNFGRATPSFPVSGGFQRGRPDPRGSAPCGRGEGVGAHPTHG